MVHPSFLVVMRAETALCVGAAPRQAERVEAGG